MKPRSNHYHMLISSLPPLPPRFDVDRLPISPERLQDRLRMLEPEDAQEIARLMEVLRWAQQFEEPNDDAVVKRYDELIQGVRNPLVREVVTVAMDARMIMTALRRRRRGLGPPRDRHRPTGCPHPPPLQPARPRARPCLSQDSSARSVTRAGGCAELLSSSYGGDVGALEETCRRLLF